MNFSLKKQVTPNAGSSHQNWTRPTEFSSCCTDRLELSSGTPALDTD